MPPRSLASPCRRAAEPWGAGRGPSRTARARGRLHSIDLLPDHADETVRWALGALAARKMSAVWILDEFNQRLSELDPPCGPISAGAFNRYGLRFAAQARRLAEAREAAAALAERLEDMPEGDVGLMLGETIKALLNDIILDKMVDGDSPSIGDLRAAAEAVQRLELARKASHEVAARARKAVIDKAVQAVDAAVTAGQIDAEAAARAREIMGFA